MATTDEPAVQSNADYKQMGPTSGGPLVGYESKQCGCIGVLALIASIGYFAAGAALIGLLATGHDLDDSDLDSDSDSDGALGGYAYGIGDCIGYGIGLFLCGMATMFIYVRDGGDHLILETGPCRWMICGFGVEKIKYEDIYHYSVSRSCFYGFGLPCYTSVKLFNSCSCCCGEMASACGHSTVKLTIKERPQAEGAIDEDTCCLEKCCLNCFCGENGEWLGKGCCCQPCINPCNSNFCIMNTVFVSTNDPDGFVRLLHEKSAGGGNAAEYAEI